MAVILAAALACASGKLPRRAHATLAGTVKPAPDGRGADDAEAAAKWLIRGVSSWRRPWPGEAAERRPWSHAGSGPQADLKAFPPC